MRCSMNEANCQENSQRNQRGSARERCHFGNSRSILAGLGQTVIAGFWWCEDGWRVARVDVSRSSDEEASDVGAEA